MGWKDQRWVEAVDLWDSQNRPRINGNKKGRPSDPVGTHLCQGDHCGMNSVSRTFVLSGASQWMTSLTYIIRYSYNMAFQTWLAALK